MTVEKDLFKEFVQSFCRREKMPRKTRFSKVDDLITISIKNESDEGLDGNCFKVINLVMSTVGRQKTKFIQVPIMYPNSEKIDRVDIIFEKDSYNDMVKSLFTAPS